jgi:hypothetical protein
LIIFLHPDSKLRTPEEIDTLLSAEFPDEDEEPDVTTLILNEYRQSSSSSVLAFKFKVLRQLRMPIARYCLGVELVRVRSKVDS